MFACARRQNRPGLAHSCIGVRSDGGMERGFVVVVCRACADPPCARTCPTDALTPREDGGVSLNESVCIGCGLCREACALGAVYWNEETGKPMICVHCGYCAKYCPYGVLELERSEVPGRA
jgi:Fe-S-cluster-containing dehydrogenase component